MAATFLVKTTLRIGGRPGFYLVGEIVTGIVKAGMVAKIWLDGAAYVHAPIDAVEFVDFPGGKCLVALHVQSVADEAYDFLEELCPRGAPIDLLAPA
jgi:hypothetical protein